VAIEDPSLTRPTSHPPTTPPERRDSTNVGEVVDLVKDYARQETLGPLRGAGRWLAFGTLGAVLLAAGTSIVVLGVLRYVQTEHARTFAGKWVGLLPYVIALAISLTVIGVAASRIGKSSLHKE
jgi:hypothetical protein